MPPPIAKQIAASWNGGTCPEDAVSTASDDHISTAAKPTRVAAFRPAENATPLTASVSDHVLTAVCGQRRAGDEARIVRRQEYHAARDLFRRAQSTDRNLRKDVLLEHFLGHGLHHLGADVSRTDGVDRDAASRALLRQRLGEAELARLGGGVIGLADLALLAVHRGDVDDAPELARPHALDHRAAHVEQRAQIGVDDGRPLLRRHAVEHGVAGDPRVVDQDLDGPELRLDLLDPGRAGLMGAHVPLVDRDARRGLEFLCRLVVAAVIRRHLAAGGAQRLGDRRADAARPAGDHRHACHDAFLPDLGPVLRPISSCSGTRGAPGRALRRAKAPQSRSTHIAMPQPPPMQRVASPFLDLRFAISCSSVTSTRVPEAPIGCPMAIAPPLTLTLAGSQPRSLLTAQACAANASFASTRSRSSTFQPAFFSAAREAGIGPVPMMAGSTPACAQETIRASTLRPSLAAWLAFMSTTAAAPSLIPEAFPAVTVPSLSKAGLSLETASNVVPWRGDFSASTTKSPLRVLMVTGTISSLKRPLFWAASALFWEATANSSCWRRVICHCLATFSAVLPML